MTSKIFYDKHENQLTLHINKDNFCYICVGKDVLGEAVEYNGSIVLDSDDLTELISELKSIKRQMDNNE